MRVFSVLLLTGLAAALPVSQKKFVIYEHPQAGFNPSQDSNAFNRNEATQPPASHFEQASRSVYEKPVIIALKQDGVEELSAFLIEGGLRSLSSHPQLRFMHEMLRSDSEKVGLMLNTASILPLRHFEMPITNVFLPPGFSLARSAEIIRNLGPIPLMLVVDKSDLEGLPLDTLKVMSAFDVLEDSLRVLKDTETEFNPAEASQTSLYHQYGDGYKKYVFLYPAEDRLLSSSYYNRLSQPSLYLNSHSTPAYNPLLSKYSVVPVFVKDYTPIYEKSHPFTKILYSPSTGEVIAQPIVKYSSNYPSHNYYIKDVIPSTYSQQFQSALAKEEFEPQYYNSALASFYKKPIFQGLVPSNNNFNQEQIVSVPLNDFNRVQVVEASAIPNEYNQQNQMQIVKEGSIPNEYSQEFQKQSVQESVIPNEYNQQNQMQIVKEGAIPNEYSQEYKKQIVKDSVVPAQAFETVKETTFSGDLNQKATKESEIPSQQFKTIKETVISGGLNQQSLKERVTPSQQYKTQTIKETIISSDSPQGIVQQLPSEFISKVSEVSGPVQEKVIKYVTVTDRDRVGSQNVRKTETISQDGSSKTITTTISKNISGAAGVVLPGEAVVVAPGEAVVTKTMTGDAISLGANVRLSAL